MSSQIAASLVGEPPVIELVATDVSSALMYEIELMLPGATTNAAGALLVDPFVLIQNRRRLVDLMIQAEISLVRTDDVSELLRRSSNDDRAFIDALREPAEPSQPLPLALDLNAYVGDYQLIRSLREFQMENVTRLAELAHGANFSVPGAGKTTVAYVLHALKKAAGEVDKLLVVAPLSAYSAWEEDAHQVLSPAPSVARMTGTQVPKGDVVLVNYQRLPSALASISAWSVQHRVHLLVDEAHRAKRGVSGEWGRALMALAPLAVRRDILTGTPAPNHPRDLVALLDFLWPSRRASGRIPRVALQREPTEAAVRRVSDAIGPFFVRTDKSRLRLPDVQLFDAPVEMGELQASIYGALRNRYAGSLNLDARDAAIFARMGEISMYLLQAASSPRLLRNSADPARAYRFPPLAIPPGSRLSDMVEEYADREVPAKIERACRIVSTNAALGRKTLVWSNFPDNLLDLQQQLAALEPAVVYGGVPSADEASTRPGVTTREREIARFKTDGSCKVLLANPAAMSEGVSLHRECHDAIYLDRTFNAGQYLQSLDRIHRLGLDVDVVTTVTILSSRGTIDETVNRRVRTKAERLAFMLADENLTRMALPDEEDGVVFLDDDRDLHELLEHLGRSRQEG